MILIFDLDDTLYDERTYVDSGLRAVARYGEERFGWDAEASFRFMQDVLAREGRGRIFDRWLAAHGRTGRTLVKDCLRVYRHHSPTLRLMPEAKAVLRRFSASHPLYLVTDGHKVVQKKKLESLKIEPMFRRVMITHRFGIRNAKPSTYCFELIRKMERCEWGDMVYVGDNPAKDFVNLNKSGAFTVRVLTGAHRYTVALLGHDAAISIENLSALPAALSAWGQRR